jgi:hypothetical protein
VRVSGLARVFFLCENSLTSGGPSSFVVSGENRQK